MEVFDEKCLIYEQMKRLLEERREISRQYWEWKLRLDKLEEMQSDCKKSLGWKDERIDFHADKEIQSYYLERKSADRQHRSHKDYGLTIASILKEAGRPLSTKELYQCLTNQLEKCPSYSKFTNNILPKIKNDHAIHVERATRGYWQYSFG